MPFWFGNKNKGHILTEKGKDYITNSKTTEVNENNENLTEENLTKNFKKSERTFSSSDEWIIVEGYKGFYQSVFNNEVKYGNYHETYYGNRFGYGGNSNIKSFLI